MLSTESISSQLGSDIIIINLLYEYCTGKLTVLSTVYCTAVLLVRSHRHAGTDGTKADNTDTATMISSIHTVYVLRVELVLFTVLVQFMVGLLDLF